MRQTICTRKKLLFMHDESVDEWARFLIHVAQNKAAVDLKPETWPWERRANCIGSRRRGTTRGGGRSALPFCFRGLQHCVVRGDVILLLRFHASVSRHARF